MKWNELMNENIAIWFKICLDLLSGSTVQQSCVCVCVHLGNVAC